MKDLFNSFKKNVTNNLINIPGWRSERKIVVIESDDWGSIRMPSKKVYEKLLLAGYKPDLDPYLKYDSLASETDLSALFNVLSSVRDVNGNFAKITANTIVANPDFKKIKEADFQQYYYEPFVETLKRYPNHENSFNLWKEGINQGVFLPQFHGREHLNVSAWMNGLKNNDKMLHEAFNNEMISISSVKSEFRNSYMEAFDCRNLNEDNSYGQIAKKGLLLFNELLGFKSESFIAPCYTWPISLEKTLFENGIHTIQGIIYQSIPEYTEKGRNYKSKIHFLGSQNKLGQTYLIRNNYFEPSLNPSFDSVDYTLSRIRMAFRYGKPAIISSHRLNFIGSIDIKNRDKNLLLFSLLLKDIVKKWPNVEFMSSNELGKLIRVG